MRSKVEDFSQYEKDSFSKAVVNVDKKSLDGYILQRQRLTKTFALEDEVKQLKEDIGEIKSLLSQLINNK
jgi:conjugal transfer/entry exclusion protein